MQHIDRRTFLRLAGSGSAAALAAAVPASGLMAGARTGRLSFRAVAGLPTGPLPSMATHVLEGTVELAASSGLINSRVMAGHPGARSGVALPGVSRTIRVIGVRANGPQLTLSGVVEDRSQLAAGEKAEVEIVIDRARRSVRAPLIGREVSLRLE